jgi:UDP-glucose 4-epimerase
MGHLMANDRFTFIEGDVRTDLREGPFDEIWNLASPASQPQYRAYPVGALLITVIGMKSVLDLARARGARVFRASTSEVYGDPELPPQVENYRGAAINYRQAYGLKWAGMRYFYTAGCDPNGDLHENHDPETHDIPRAIQTALRTGPRFKIFGTDCPTQDGSAVRDYVHVSDLASAHAKAIPYLDGGGASRAFDLATGNSTSVMSLLNSVEKATGRPVPWTLRRDGRGTRLCCMPWPTARTSRSAGRRSLLTSTTRSRRRPNGSYGSTTRQMWPEGG